ncbi:hypothetical protein AB0H82_32855 [Streptomyces sp. NPDC050732]|uniref:hypothetical protein n=1 Tax=Streptomyces sp. NPDC050732 TaxID=3154632 RepID=UPI00342FC2D7
MRSQRTVLAAFDAFRQRHYQPYLDYALLRLGRGEAAEATIAAAFTELAVSWHQVLRSSEPAAIAWRMLHQHIDHALGHARTDVSALGGVGALQRDARLLRDQLHLSSERTAEVMGITESDLAGLLGPASRPKG